MRSATPLRAVLRPLLPCAFALAVLSPVTGIADVPPVSRQEQEQEQEQEQTAPEAGLPDDARLPLYNQGPKEVATAEGGMVATQLPVVTEGALEVLRAGGNAVDAFATAVFLQHVNDYHQVSLFGSISGLYYDAATDTYHAFNGFAERPLAGRCGEGDPSQVAIPGTPKALEALTRRFGTRPWAEYLEPAIRSAEDGVLVTSFMYRSNYSLFEGGDLIKKNAAARDFYLPDGHLVPVGHRWKMPALAETLRQVASQGADYMYTGAWGREFVGQARSRGQCVSMDDMAAYEVRWPDPVEIDYRGRRVILEPPPNSGGLLVAHNLNILENFDLPSMQPFWRSATTLEVMARTFGRVEDEMKWTVQDPLAFHNPLELWLDPAYGEIGARFVRQTMPLPGIRIEAAGEGATEEDPDLSDAATPGPVAASSSTRRQGRPADGPLIDFSSNHNVIVDAEGNWITSLHTGHGGSPGTFIDGVRATGSGVHAETTGPGRRVLAQVTGIFVVGDDGAPVLSLGTPGFPPQPVTEVLVDILDFGLHPEDAADAPRFWAFLDDDRHVEIESRLEPGVREEIAARGIELVDLGTYNWHTGSMQIVWKDPETGLIHGVSDPRRLGYVKGY